MDRSPEPVIRFAKGPVVFGPQTCHVKAVRDRQASEQARKAAAKQRKEAELAAARNLLSQPAKHRKLTEAEKAARKEARHLLRAHEGPKRRTAGSRTGDIEAACGHGGFSIP